MPEHLGQSGATDRDCEYCGEPAAPGSRQCEDCAEYWRFVYAEWKRVELEQSGWSRYLREREASRG
jgi:hypothetical protein